MLARVCKLAGLTGVTPHVLRHSYASIAAELGFSELTIAGLLGHRAGSVTAGYVHLDQALVIAADRVAAVIAGALEREPEAKVTTTLRTPTVNKTTSLHVEVADVSLMRTHVAKLASGNR